MCAVYLPDLRYQSRSRSSYWYCLVLFGTHWSRPQCDASFRRSRQEALIGSMTKRIEPVRARRGAESTECGFAATWFASADDHYSRADRASRTATKSESNRGWSIRRLFGDRGDRFCDARARSLTVLRIVRRAGIRSTSRSRSPRAAHAHVGLRSSASRGATELNNRQRRSPLAGRQGIENPIGRTATSSNEPRPTARKRCELTSIGLCAYVMPYTQRPAHCLRRKRYSPICR
jgi:hypothetical protein